MQVGLSQGARPARRRVRERPALIMVYDDMCRNVVL
jgi:hypothetical protein